MHVRLHLCPDRAGPRGGEDGQRQRDRAVVLVVADRCQAWPHRPPAPGRLRPCQQGEQWLGPRGLGLFVTGGDAPTIPAAAPGSLRPDPELRWRGEAQRLTPLHLQRIPGQLRPRGPPRQPVTSAESQARSRPAEFRNGGGEAVCTCPPGGADASRVGVPQAWGMLPDSLVCRRDNPGSPRATSTVRTPARLWLARVLKATPSSPPEMGRPKPALRS